MTLVAIDPGVTWTGVAIFQNLPKRNHIIRAWRTKGLGFKGDFTRILHLGKQVVREIFDVQKDPIDALVMEWPQVYRESKQQKRDPNDLLPLAALDSLIAAFLDNLMCANSTFKLVKPREWKGQMNGVVTASRILSRLQDNELERIEDGAAFQQHVEECISRGKDVSHPAHNTFDAVGIGLYELGRFEPRKVFVR